MNRYRLINVKTHWQSFSFFCKIVVIDCVFVCVWERERCTVGIWCTVWIWLVGLNKSQWDEISHAPNSGKYEYLASFSISLFLSLSLHLHLSAMGCRPRRWRRQPQRPSFYVEIATLTTTRQHKTAAILFLLFHYLDVKHLITVVFKTQFKREHLNLGLLLLEFRCHVN